MDIRLLGQLEGFADDGSPLVIRGTKTRTLLAVLALHRGAPVGSDRLIDVLWGEHPPGNPGNALQALVLTLRRAVGAANVTTTEAGYALAIGPGDLDVSRFEQLVADGCRQLEAGDAALAAAALHEALALRRDEPLVEFAFSEFATGDRTRLEELHLVALERRVEADLALGRHGELVAELEDLCEQHPLRERLWELRMLALYRSGRQADALRAYADARERLIDEFGLEPGPGLRQLEARVLAQDPHLELPGGRRIGEDAAPAGNLRQRLTSFVGRDEELARLAEAITASRLVTLIGPGGAGKTRLAVEAAAGLEPAPPDGAWIVELAGVRDPEAVAPAVSAALRLTRSEGVVGSTLELVVGQLRGRSLVVVLDNCEHLIGEAAAVTEMLLGELPGLRIIATSREALGVPGELLVPVRGLALGAATEVFADRAHAVRADFIVDGTSRALVEDVCRRLDGLPLAVELAAARLRALPLSQLAELLDDRFRVLTGGARTAMPRQQTLRAVVDWSYDLLFEDERRLFARLSVFAGGWSLEGAEAVCGDALLPAADVVDLLLHLVDKSLVVADFDGAGEARYSQLQTLWHYARERLAQSGEATALRERHARWYLAVAEAARDGLRGRTGPSWRNRLAAEAENLRAALDWFVDAGEADAALRLTEGIAWEWYLRGEPVEALRWLDDALAVPGSSAPARAAATIWRAYFSAWIDVTGDPLAQLWEAIVELRSASWRDRLSDGLLIAAELHTRTDELEAAQAALDEASVIVKELGDEWSLATHDYLASRVLAGMGRLDAAEDAARASVARFEVLGEEWLVFEGMGLSAIINESRGDLDAAAATYVDLMARARAAAMPNYHTQWAARLAGVRACQGDDEHAAQLYADVAAAAFLPVNVGWALIGQAGAARRTGDAETARLCLERALALYEELSLDLGCSATLTALCWWSFGTGDLDGAARFAADACARATSNRWSRPAAAAAIAAAAVAFARSGSPGDQEALAALIEERDHRGAGRYDGLRAGSLGEYFDEPDVAAFVRDHGLEPAGR